MSDSESSSSDHFEDAVESVEIQQSPTSKAKRNTMKRGSGGLVATVELPSTVELQVVEKHPVAAGTLTSPDIEDQIEILTGDMLSGRDQRWRRLEKLRRRGEAGCEGEQEGGQSSPLNTTNGTPPDSTESSVEGIYLSGVRSLHPFKVVESDARSVQSESRSITRSTSSQQKVEVASGRNSLDMRTRDESEFFSAGQLEPVQEVAFKHEAPRPVMNIPDIVSSSKPVGGCVASCSPVPAPSILMGPPTQPLPPPRRKKTTGSQESSLEHSISVESEGTIVASRPVTLPLSVESSVSMSPPSLPSPASTVASLTKDLEKQLVRSPVQDNPSVHNLNIHSATRGDFVVRPQDDENSRGSSAPPKENEKAKVGAGISQDPKGECRAPGNEDVERGKESIGRERPRKDGYASGGSGGHHSGGSGGYHSSRSQVVSGRGSGESRKSTTGSGASEGGMIKQLNLFVRTKSDSGKRLTDQEILQQIKVKNLDTGNEMDLATAEEQLPQSINPLSLHIMRLTSEYTGTMLSDTRSLDSDEESLDSRMSDFEIGQGKKKATFGRLLGNVTRTARSAAKVLTEEVTKRQKTKEEKQEEKLGRLATDICTTDGVQVAGNAATANGFKRIQAHKSGPYDFENIQFGQDLSGHHQGPIWCMKFSLCGRLLATAGQDCILRIWVLRDKHEYFHDMRRRYQAEHEGVTEEQLCQDDATQDYLADPDSRGHIFMDRPFVTYTGHTSDLLDVSWSKNFFILTSSMDKTVRLWHISRKECLCVFQHIDFVTALAFHPRNDQYFISGSLDGKIRLWNIPDKKVALWNEVDGATKLITTANYCQNGKFAVVGTYDGRCIFFSTDQLKYHTTIHVRSARGKNARGRKITGIEPMPGEDKILITSNDSRIRLYDLRDLSLVCKYKGYTNLSSQIKACFSPDGRYICAGSENQCVFLWSTLHVPQAITARKDRNNYYEAIRAHSAVVTCSLFAPEPRLVLEAVERGREAAGKEGICSKEQQGEVVISGDFDGDIKIFINQSKAV